MHKSTRWATVYETRSGTSAGGRNAGSCTTSDDIARERARVQGRRRRDERKRLLPRVRRRALGRERRVALRRRQPHHRRRRREGESATEGAANASARARVRERLPDAKAEETFVERVMATRRPATRPRLIGPTSDSPVRRLRLQHRRRVNPRPGVRVLRGRRDPARGLFTSRGAADRARLSPVTSPDDGAPLAHQADAHEDERVERRLDDRSTGELLLTGSVDETVKSWRASDAGGLELVHSYAGALRARARGSHRANPSRRVPVAPRPPPFPLTLVASSAISRSIRIHRGALASSPAHAGGSRPAAFRRRSSFPSLRPHPGLRLARGGAERPRRLERPGLPDPRLGLQHARDGGGDRVPPRGRLFRDGVFPAHRASPPARPSRCPLAPRRRGHRVRAQGRVQAPGPAATARSEEGQPGSFLRRATSDGASPSQVRTLLTRRGLSVPSRGGRWLGR